ncbi:hypothetical protein OH76DRAFT_1528166 [Lentinus brumalis]|uniref:DUF4100 domain-containing protein n=1 Tax=Lentinus brumalis TaxID=2498619 RepID=A0A371D270_9APHY|nr:hypothetical protein OH76DRAFT_1528166 [Polyporus brumalis]
MPPKTAGHLPLKDDKNAPRFKGKHVEEFITSLEDIANANTVEVKQLPKAVVRYASSKVKSVLEAEVAFEGDDWDIAKERLRYIFGSLTHTHKPDPRKLRKFAELSAANNSVTSLVTLDQYNFEFSRRAGKLVQNGAMSQRELNDLFHHGLPKRLRTAILKDLVDVVRKRSGKGLSESNQPTKTEVWDTARDYYKAVDAMRKRAGTDSSSDESLSDSSAAASPSSSSDSDSDDTSRDRRRKGRSSRSGKRRKRRSASTQPKRSSSEQDKPRERTHSHSDSEVEPLSRKDFQREFEAMTQRWFRDNGLNSYGPGPSGSGPSHYQSRSFAPRMCYVCGKTEGMDLDHLLGMHRCPETTRLVQDGFVIFSPVNGRLLFPNGQPLPSTDHMPQGIAAFLRDPTRTVQQQTPAQARCDPPPHQASVMSVGLCLDGRPVLSYPSVVSSSLGQAHAFPVSTRSQGKLPTAAKSVHWQDSAPLVDPAPTTPLVTPPASSRPPSVNTEKGWRDAQTDKARPSSTTYDDSTSRIRTTGRQSPLRFTSDVQDSVSVASLEDHILGTRVTLTLRECLGMSTSLQKRMAALVKTRRDFGSTTQPRESATAQAASNAASVADSGSVAPHLEAEISFTQGSEHLDDLLDRYAASIALADSRQFAMVSGVIQVVFAGRKADFLVDSGSELNLASQRLYNPKTMKLDEDGSRWTLRGIGGDPIALLGCALDVPVQLGGRNFDHHFFISSSHYGSHDGILGQPWLSFFAARFEYSRDGATTLRVHPSGTTEGLSVAVQMCPPRHPRNADRLVLTSKVEEVSDCETSDEPSSGPDF